jgi:hypothetical protein
MVLIDIIAAPIATGNTMSQWANTPAASGIAKML